MKKITLTEEIGRMFEIMNNNEGMVILESTLLLEQSIFSAIKGAEKFIEKNTAAKAKVEKYLEKNAESFGERYSQFYEKNIVSKKGREKLREFIIDVSSVSPAFAKNFVTKNENLIVDLEKEKGAKLFDEIMTSSFGEKILNSYRTLHPTPPVGSRAGSSAAGRTGAAAPKPPKSKQKSLPIPIPSELKDSEGVKDFQKWLNDNKPGWFKNKEMEIGGDNYGRFGKSTSKAWETHQIEYLEKTKPPSDLKTKEQIQDFQDWMDSKHPNWIVDSDGNVRNLLQGKGWGKYDINTSKAWEKYGEKYKITYGTRQRIKSVDLNRVENPITSKKLSTIEKIFSSDTEIMGGIRRFSLLFLDSLTKVMKGEEVVIDDIFGKFITVLDKFKAGGALADSQTYFRDISISLKALQDGKIDIYSTFVKDIEGVLKSSRKYTDDEIAKVIEQLKQKDFDAFNPKNTSWLRRLWGESSWNNFRKTLIDKELKLHQKLLEIVKRGAMVLTTGAIKLPSEYAKHITDKGVGSGSYDIWWIATIITKVTMPIFLTTMGTLFAMVKGFFAGFQNENIVEEFKDNLEKQYMSVFTFGNVFSEITIPSIIVSAIVPFHWHWNNFLGWLKDTMDNLVNGKIFESWNKQAKNLKVVAKQEYDKGVKKGTEALSQVTNYKDSVINAGNKKIEDLQNQLNNRNNIIDNSETGFRTWCSNNNYKFKSFSNSVGTTDDGQDWVWNKDLTTFEKY